MIPESALVPNMCIDDHIMLTALYAEGVPGAHRVVGSTLKWSVYDHSTVYISPERVGQVTMNTTGYFCTLACSIKQG